MDKNKLLKTLNKYSIFFILLVLFFAFSVLSPYFLQPSNLIKVAHQLCVGILLAYGEMLLIISGFLDLSVGSVLALAGVLSVATFKATGSMPLAFLVAISISVACNIINAFFVAELNVPAFIATLGMQQAARGLVLYYTHGANILQIGDYRLIGQGEFLGVPIPVLIVIIVTIIMWYLTRHTRYGRGIYAIGGSRPAAEASGIDAKKSIFTSYIFNGILVALAGMIFMARNNAGLANGAVGYEMTGLTAAIVGGTSFTGGIGTVTGTVVGAFIIGFLENFMNLQGVDSFIQQIIEGAIIVLAVAFDIASKSGKSKKVILVNKNKTKIKGE
ncbi:MAG: ABC transporter permease [Lachnospiraceae bacterium]|nr:ABC transporter permease [Lachnospiraceae bacterium]